MPLISLTCLMRQIRLLNCRSGAFGKPRRAETEHTWGSPDVIQSAYGRSAADVAEYDTELAEAALGKACR